VNEATFRGVLTDATFAYPLARQLDAPGWGERYEGTRLDTGERVYIHKLDTLVDGYEHYVALARSAIELAQRPELRECQALIQLVDFRDESIDPGWGDPFEVLHSAWEWAAATLRDLLDAGGTASADAVEAGVVAALACLHAAELVHSDVTPNNIFLVDGAWKLGDFNTCVPRDSPIVGLPKDRRYVFPGVELGDRARPEMDAYGLAAVLDELAV
jgi:hypothetical protein